MALQTLFAAALNRLLEAEPWARARLAPFAGQAVELRAPPLPALRMAIAHDGRVAAAPRDMVAALVVTIRPDAPAAWLRGEEHLLRAVHASGDPALAEAVMFLVRHLRWDAEEDLSRVVGDVAARRIGQAARDFTAWQADAGRRLVESVADYAIHERRLLIQRSEHDQLAKRIADLRDGVDRLQKRIERLG